MTGTLYFPPPLELSRTPVSPAAMLLDLAPELAADPAAAPHSVILEGVPAHRSQPWWTAVFAAVLARHTGRDTIALLAPDGHVVFDPAADVVFADLCLAAEAQWGCGRSARADLPDVVARRNATTASVALADPDLVSADLRLIVEDTSVRLVAPASWTLAAAQQLAGALAVSSRAVDLDSTMTVADMPLIDDLWQQRIAAWNDTGIEWPATSYLELLAAQSSAAPADPAVIQGDRTISFADFDLGTNQLAHRLHQAGVARADRVGLLCPRGTDYVLAAIGILKAGATIVPLDPVNPDRRLAFMVEDAGIQVVLTTASLRERSPAGTEALIVADLIGGPDDASPLPAGLSDDAVSHVIYTSGSTGVPKGVLERLGAVRNLVHWTGRAYGVRPGDRASWLSTPGFAVQIMEWMPYLALGATICIPDAAQAQTPDQIRDWLVAEQVTHAMLVAALAERAWALPWPAETALRVMVTTAERVHSWPPVDTPFRVAMTYGTTETTNALSCLDLGVGTDLTSAATPAIVRGTRPVPVGRPIANVRAYLLDDRGRPVPPGVVGSLHIAGAGLAHGYLDRPDLTAQRFRPSPLPDDDTVFYASGDLGRYRADGAIELLGRDDAQVKVRGFRVELGEVETAVAALVDVGEAVVTAHEASPGDIWLVAYTTPANPERTVDPATLRAELSDRVPFYMVPTIVVPLATIPRLPNGKTDLRALPDPEAVMRSSDTGGYTAPTDEVEVSLANTWSRLFSGRTVGTTDNFFDLGGHSLLAFRLLDAVRTEFGVELSMSDLYEQPTIGEFARVVVQGRGGGGRFADLPPITTDPANRHQPFPLTESQQALWIGRGSLVELGNVGCHGYFEWESPDLDLARFFTAWDRVVARHDALRTVVLPDGTQQVLAELPPWQPTVVDLRTANAADAEEALLAIRAEMAHHVLDEAAWPPFDLRAARLPAGTAAAVPVRLQLALDFLAADAWSYFQVLIPDLVRLYEDPSVRLPSLELTFRDYVLGVRSSLTDSDLYRRSRWYWTDRLDTLPAAPAMPERPAEQPDVAVRFERRSARITADRWQQVCGQAARVGVTPAAVLAAAYAEVLGEWCTEQRFCLNFPLFNRLPLHPQTSQIIGDTTTTMLLQVDGDGDTFADRVLALQRQLWTDLEHRYFSGVEVLRELTRRRGALAPAMPVIMTCLVGQPPTKQDTAIGTPVYAISQTPQVSLDFQVFDADDGIRFNWDFIPAVFPDNCAETMFVAFCDLLDRLATPASWEIEVFGYGPEADRCLSQRRQPLSPVAGDDRIGASWERYWSSIDATGRGGDVLWDADSDDEMDWLLERATAHFDPALPVVDLGCGNGRYSRVLATRFPTVIGVDVSASAIAMAEAESAGVAGVRFEVLDAAADGAVDALAARLGPANVFIRGVLHVLDDTARSGVADTLRTLLADGAGAGLILEPAYADSSFGYVGFVGGAKGRAVELVRPLEAAGVRHSSRFGDEELSRFFPAAGWAHLESADVAMHAVDPQSDQSTLRLPGYYAAVRRQPGAPAQDQL